MPERLDTYAPVRPVAYLLGQLRVAGQVGKGNSNADLANLAARLVLHVANDVLLNEVVEEAAVEVIDHRREER